MEVIMRQTLPVTLILLLSLPTTSASEENRGRAQAVDVLLKQLADNDPDKVCAAARALGRLGPAAKVAAPALTGRLKDRDSRVRLSAAEALWRLHHQAGNLVPVWSELLGAGNADVRAA